MVEARLTLPATVSTSNYGKARYGHLVVLRPNINFAGGFERRFIPSSGMLETDPVYDTRQAMPFPADPMLYRIKENDCGKQE